MEEAQRFVRFVLPGLILIIELLGYLLVSGDICLNQLIDQVNTVGVAFSGLLASGGLGFLLGVIYYVLVWIDKLKIGVDLRPLLDDAESKGWLRMNRHNVRVTTNELTKRGAWRVIVSFYNTREESSLRIKGAIRRMDRLTDLGNGLGTTFLASLASLLSFVTYNLISSSMGEFSWRGWLSVGIGLFMLFIHFWNYRGVMQDAENIFRKILLDEFEDEYYRKNKVPVRLQVFKSDLRKRP